jgi:hypothetical protein
MASSNGQELIPDFRERQRSHFVATTKELLTTGVNVPCVRNIVFFRYLQSPILFHQMVGRGTRIHEESGKLMFRILDYLARPRSSTHFISRRFAAGGSPATATSAPIKVKASGRSYTGRFNLMAGRTAGAGDAEISATAHRRLTPPCRRSPSFASVGQPRGAQGLDMNRHHPRACPPWRMEASTSSMCWPRLPTAFHH